MKVLIEHSQFVPLLPAQEHDNRYLYVGLQDPRHDVKSLNERLSELHGVCREFGEARELSFRKQDGRLVLGRVTVGEVIVCLYPSLLDAQFYAKTCRGGDPPLSVSETALG